MRATRNFLRRFLWLVALLLCAASARAVILFATEANTTPPEGELAGSGWQYQGDWGAFLGTPIAPRFFLTSAHVGNPGTLVYNGVGYTVVRTIVDPVGSDLRLYEVSTAFPSFAPLYTKHEEAGKALVVIGRGTERGEPILFGEEQRGWRHGAWSSIRRWGTNNVSRVIPYRPDDDLLYATFDADVSPNEAHLSGGDSGGGVFINDDGEWKLAGINFAIDGPFSRDGTAATEFHAAFFDASEFYRKDRNSPTGYTFIPGPGPVPSGFYATRVSTRTGWIYSVTDPVGDVDADGMRNLAEYAQRLDPAEPDIAHAPQVAQEGNALTLTFRKSTTATDVTFAVEQSDDLVGWSDSQAQQTVVATAGSVQTVKASVPIIGERMFLRLRVTQP